MFQLNLDSEQKALVELAREFAEQEMRPVEIALDRIADPEEVFSSEAYRDVLRKAWEIGFHKMRLPKEVGGLGVDPITGSLVVEELCRGGVGIANAIVISATAAGAAAVRGPGLLFDQFVKPFCEDTRAEHIGALAVVEPDHGSDLFESDNPEIGLETRAVQDGDDYIISGAKAGFVSNGGIANSFLLNATLQPELGMRGSAFFVVPRDLPGISCGRALDKLGLRCLNQAEVYFDEVRVSSEYLLAPPMPELQPDTMATFLCGGNAFVGTTAVGIMRAAYEEAVVYAKERIQGAKPIFEHQHIALKLLDAYATIQAARSVLLHSIATNENRFPGDLPLAIGARRYACNESIRVTSDMIQVLGGYGISKEYPLEKHLRDAKLTQIEDGTVEALGLLAAKRLDETSARPC
jgi:alkylation response protein AidB-like acyl-CoA dehydrogenase